MIKEVVDLKLLREFKHAQVLNAVSQPQTVVVIATSNYIPMDEFKSIFNFIDERAGKAPVKKVIFDKTKLSVFHQPSMEWYFTDWKERMYKKGCSSHRKILPQDKMFINSVKVGRQKINQQYPDKIFHQLDIQYTDSIEEALAK
ncbi:MAG: hypothetical protein ACOCXH_09755 [Cyclobacteriaceae bacterium]